MPEKSKSRGASGVARQSDRGAANRHINNADEDEDEQGVDMDDEDE